jgi:hypothetical protein
VAARTRFERPTDQGARAGNAWCQHWTAPGENCGDESTDLPSDSFCWACPHHTPSSRVLTARPPPPPNNWRYCSFFAANGCYIVRQHWLDTCTPRYTGHPPLQGSCGSRNVHWTDLHWKKCCSCCAACRPRFLTVGTLEPVRYAPFAFRDFARSVFLPLGMDWS